MARNETGISNSTKAINKFKEMLNSSDQYFNEGEIPANESNANAHLNCSSVEDAKTHCPKRMEAMERWFSQTREVFCVKQGEVEGLTDLCHCPPLILLKALIK